jgi:phosphopantetheine--protein transferase-like protein
LRHHPEQPEIDEAAEEATRSVRNLLCPPAGIALFAGHDLVYLPDFAPKLRRRFIERAFTPREIAEVEGGSDPLPRFAARWAAKEAAYKALCQLALTRDLSTRGLARFRDYEVLPHPRLSAPALHLHGAPAALVKALGGGAHVVVSLSLSHDGDYASAFVIIASAAPPVKRGRA